MVTTPIHSFSSRVREAVDIPAIVAELERAVLDAVGPRFAGIWADPVITTAWPSGPELPTFDPEDPAVAHALRHPSSWPLDDITIDSPAVDFVRVGGARVIVPLVSLGVFVGLLVLGPPTNGAAYA